MAGIAGWLFQCAVAVLLPWHVPGAEARQVVEILSQHDRTGAAVAVRLMAPPGVRPVLVRADQPERPLAAYFGEQGQVSFRPGPLKGGEPAYVVAYWGRGVKPSPALDRPPEPADDYASVRYGDAWDFEEGDTEGIDAWGNRRTDYGKIEVRDGVLVIPVKGRDPWFIWGVMWGSSDDPRAERIDSGVYRYLRMRVKQSCGAATWAVFVTDMQGKWKAYRFVVRGKQWQEIRIDMKRRFKGFWDGRMMRALRIDPTEERPGAVVEIDWVRLEPEPVQVRLGPVLTREQVAARAKAARLAISAPARAEAGSRAKVQVEVVDAKGAGVAACPVVVSVVRAGEVVAATAGATGRQGEASIAAYAGTVAGEAKWQARLCDDMGDPVGPAAEARLVVMPSRPARFVLQPEKRWVDVAKGLVKVRVAVVDRFGNERAERLRGARFSVSGGGRIGGRLPRSVPAAISVRLPRKPLVRCVIAVRDARGIRGECEVMTVAYRKPGFEVLGNGYFAVRGGPVFVPLGGFYANWPQGPTGEDDRLTRLLDLFPCGPSPYKAGYPWPKDVERAVRTYLEMCRRNGVTALRLMLRNMDLVGRVDEEQLKAVLHLFDLARPLGIYFNVVLFEDYNKPPYVNRAILERIVLPHYKPEELENLPPHRHRFLVEKRLLEDAADKYTDPDAIACQKDYLDQLIPVLAGRPEVFCYELENEMVRPPMSWVNEMVRYIRGIDPYTPIVGNPGPHDWPEPWRWREAEVDAFAYHPYNDGMAKADFGAVIYMRSKWAAASGKAFFTGEGGVNQSRWQRGVKRAAEEYAVRGIRDHIWLSICCGACGAFMWTPYYESEVAEFGKARVVLGHVDLRRLERARPPVAVVQPLGPGANARAYEFGWLALERGVDFDVVPPGAEAGYRHVVDLRDGGDVSAEGLPAVFRPSPGYQLAALVDRQHRQAVVYLRNAAGGIVNLGNGRACYLRQPEAADAWIAAEGWRGPAEALVFDLTQKRPRAVRMRLKGGRLEIARRTRADYVVIFRGR